MLLKSLGLMAFSIILSVSLVHAKRSELAEPLPGLSAAQLKSFEAGKVAFGQRWTEEQGLGPGFNNKSCEGCHSKPFAGGTGPIYRSNFHFGTRTEGNFDPLTDLGGSLLQEFAINGESREMIPPEATLFSKRRVTFLYGLGLVETIPDAQLLTNAARNGGRAVLDANGRVKRFGSQNQSTSLAAFVRSALREEIGLAADEVPDGIERVLRDFLLFLAPLPKEESTERSEKGEKLFHEIGCASCHVPSFTTAEGAFTTADGDVIDVEALQGITFFPYSDFLLHDMGPELDDGVGLKGAKSSEYRTIPLWGVGKRPHLLHDGRATNLRQAILFHGGDAAVSRDAAFALSENEWKLVEFFMRSL